MILNAKTLRIAHTMRFKSTSDERDQKWVLFALSAYTEGYVPGVLITKIVDASDPTPSSGRFKVAMMLKTEGLKRQVYCEGLRSKIL